MIVEVDAVEVGIVNAERELNSSRLWFVVRRLGQRRGRVRKRGGEREMICLGDGCGGRAVKPVCVKLTLCVGGAKLSCDLRGVWSAV